MPVTPIQFALNMGNYDAAELIENRLLDFTPKTYAPQSYKTVHMNTFEPESVLDEWRIEQSFTS